MSKDAAGNQERPVMFQYRIRTLLLATLGVALGTWLLFVLPDEVAVLILGVVAATVPGAITSGIVYFRGYQQAFCIGAAPPQAVILWCLMWMMPFSYGIAFEEAAQSKIFLLVATSTSMASGLGGVLIRYLAQPRAVASPRPPANSVVQATQPGEEPVSPFGERIVN